MEMKKVITILFLLLTGMGLSAQTKTDTAFTLTLAMPKSLKQGEHTNLSAKIKNLSRKEFSGLAVLEIIDTKSSKPIDGWFQNIFPQQYFTIEAGKTGIVHFDIHVPYNVANPVKCTVMAKVGSKMQTKETIIAITK